MKKKFWAVVLSVALVMGLTIPAMAMDFSSSSESGDSSEITQLAFKETSYTLSQDEDFDLSQEVIAYCGTKKICQYPNLIFSTDDLNMVFSVEEDGKVFVFEGSGSATVTVKEQDSGKKATCRIVASKGGEATGLRLSTSSIKYINGQDAEAQPSFLIEPVGGTSFSSAQQTAIAEAVNEGLDFTTFSCEEGVGEEEGKLVVKPTSGIESSITNKTYSVTVDFPRSNTSNTSTKKLSLRCNFVDGVEARAIGRKGSVKVEVGKTVDLNDYVIYNSSANYGKDCTFELDLFSNSYNTTDYAVLGADGHTLMGVAVGKLKAVAYLTGSGSEAVIPVEVVAKNASSGGTTSSGDLSVSPTTGSIKVGGTVLLTAKNASTDSDIVWTTDNDEILSLTDNGTKVTVKGLKLGTTTVSCEVDGEKIGMAKITVTNGAVSSDTEKPDESLDGSGTTTTPPPTTLPTPPIVVNPSTCDSWFSFLF